MEKEKCKIICVDIDDVCADFVPYWISLYNFDANDCLQFNDITEWNVTKFVKRRYKKKIFDYLSIPNLYDNVKPIPGALKYTDLLKNDFRLVYVTFRGNFKLSGKKFEWLNNNGFDVDEKDYIETNDKSLVNGHYMIDDNFDNISKFSGIGVLYDAPWNKQSTQFDYHRRVFNWKEFYTFVMNEEFQQQSLWE
jgi:5'(3')-deoxyribonucleotidase